MRSPLWWLAMIFLMRFHSSITLWWYTACTGLTCEVHTGLTHEGPVLWLMKVHCDLTCEGLLVSLMRIHSGFSHHGSVVSLVDVNSGLSFGGQQCLHLWRWSHSLCEGQQCPHLWKSTVVSLSMWKSTVPSFVEVNGGLTFGGQQCPHLWRSTVVLLIMWLGQQCPHLWRSMVVSLVEVKGGPTYDVPVCSLLGFLSTMVSHDCQSNLTLEGPQCSNMWGTTELGSSTEGCHSLGFILLDILTVSHLNVGLSTLDSTRTFHVF